MVVPARVDAVRRQSPGQLDSRESEAVPVDEKREVLVGGSVTLSGGHHRQSVQAGHTVCELPRQVAPVCDPLGKTLQEPLAAICAWATRDTMGILAVDNAVAVLAGEPALTPVR